MNNKVYIAGDMLTKGSQMLRAKEKSDIVKMGFDYYNPTDNKEINDKANLDNNDGLAEKIVRADTNGIMSSGIVVIEPQPFAMGTMVELGQIKGMKDVANMIHSAINSTDNKEDIIKKITDIITPIREQRVFPHYEDIRRFKGCVEEGDRRALGINQYVYGVCLDLTDNVGFYEWNEILDELKKLKQPKHKIYCIIGRTASGKTSLAKSIAALCNLVQLKSYTTRAPRSKEEELNGDHIFTNDLDYENIYKDDVVAYTEINGYKYFCTKKQLYTSDIYVIDPDGVEFLEKQNLPNLEIIKIYINCGDRELRKQRYLSRSDVTEADFDSRDLSEDEQFTRFELEGNCNYDVDNSFNTYDALIRLIDIVIGERSNDI